MTGVSHVLTYKLAEHACGGFRGMGDVLIANHEELFLSDEKSAGHFITPALTIDGDALILCRIPGQLCCMAFPFSHKCAVFIQAEAFPGNFALYLIVIELFGDDEIDLVGLPAGLSDIEPALGCFKHTSGGTTIFAGPAIGVLCIDVYRDHQSRCKSAKQYLSHCRSLSSLTISILTEVRII